MQKGCGLRAHPVIVEELSDEEGEWIQRRRGVCQCG